MSVQVILREPIENLGRRGDVVKVANGYARNYLLPRNLALPVTESNQRQIDRERVGADARDLAEKDAAEVFAGRLNQAVCVVVRRFGETNTMYGSVTSSDVAASLAVQSLEVDRRKIQIDEPLKHQGEHRVRIKVHREVTAEVLVRIVKEGEEDEPAPAPDAADGTRTDAADDQAIEPTEE